MTALDEATNKLANEVGQSQQPQAEQALQI
jgi:hypothetical protein